MTDDKRNGLYFSHPSIEDIDEIDALETASYPPDEAATRERLIYRCEKANQYFIIARKELNGPVIGFICGTVSVGDNLTHQSMFEHVPTGRTLNIHSVVVESSLRRQGIAKEMLEHYIKLYEDTKQIDQILLLSKKHLQSLYELVGFRLIGPSKVVWGEELWFEMRRDLKET
eukprot:TRINITY_DN15024_c0_g1_i1.p1 TRINITY_DN15024_c0_g1~~TRINITY_DN15024_c0_g1_i1.p1  ORF type:complete len:182 (-),score=30.73 TRINITY_DN15024_c0_g1_i1:59-574(-)